MVFQSAMSYHGDFDQKTDVWMGWASAVLWFVLLLGCSGCFGNASLQDSGLSDEVLLYRYPAVSGPRDFGNRYLSVIQVFAEEKLRKEEKREALRELASPTAQCSGALIAPRLVLTAGHCVCMMREYAAPADTRRQATAPQRGSRRAVISKEESVGREKIGAIIDATECAKTAMITTVSYEQTASGKGARSRRGDYQGIIRPHPKLELLFNDKGYQIWSSSDLAVIFLEEALEDLPILKLPAAEVQMGDPIIMVGYGPGDTRVIHGERHSGENKIGWLRRLETGSVEFVAKEQHLADAGTASHVLGGDSGGACLSREDASLLVGISSSRASNRRGESVSIFTSVYSHREWLQQQIDGQ
jgi:hypothetical protein